MIHMIKINGGKATFCSRYVKTYKYMLERDMGYPIIPSPFTSFNGVMADCSCGARCCSSCCWRVRPCDQWLWHGKYDVAVIGGKLYALGEGDLPYEIKVTSDGDITTLGRRDFHSAAAEEFLSMTAHPKIDPETGEAFAFNYHISPPLIKKYAKDESEMWWVDVPGFNISHAVNAWEEDDGDTLVVVAANLLLVEQSLEKFDLAEMKMEEIRISVKNKEVLLRRQLSTRVLNLPAIHPAYVGKKNRYAYATRVIPPVINVGLVKVDLSLYSDDYHDCVVASRRYGPDCTDNEPFFVPREPNDLDADEDDGFVVVYVHDENTQESKFLVMDAKSPTLEIVAAVKLPGRVPTAFHGLFVSESHLSKLS
ncbi:hypothetical protein DH2020_012572 [Rehmannia glutinosa]|uniref:Carotenoid cleavage dioxygenase n=1 Tax=Rehmannia glutinosa TaxID=99300 RepID=A0ABR0WZS1_REHGL